MIDRQRIATYGIATSAVATIALALWLKPWASGPLTQPIQKPDPVETSSHRVDVVFAVDTTGSMGGLIDGAKRTVWSIANHIRDVDKNVDLHVGLVAYRDLGDEYVTKDFALSGDIDSVFAELSTYQAAGGGDIPEDVDAALYDAVHKMQWRDGAKKMIFLVGDAPPASRGEVPTFEVSAREASDKQIILNTIRCGQMAETQAAWQQIAALGKGEFSTIEQNGGVQQLATPYDDKMAELSRRIDSTTVIYGAPAAHHAWAGKLGAAEAAPAAAKADRAEYYAKKPMAKGEGRAADDIVGKVATGSVDVEGLDRGMLPEDLKTKSGDELKKDLQERANTRLAAQKEIADLAAKRAEFLRTHEKASDGFDKKVQGTVDRELAK